MTYFRGVPGCVTKCDRGRGSKLAKNSVTYFMDGPLVRQNIELLTHALPVITHFYTGQGPRMLNSPVKYRAPGTLEEEA